MNLLKGCANLSASDRILIISEDEKLGWYKDNLTEALKYFAKELGIKVELLKVGAPEEENIDRIRQLSCKYDCMIYLSRLGDQRRFENIHSCKTVMSYVRNAEILASSFGCADYAAHLDLKTVLDDIFRKTKKIEISCPKGTKLSGEFKQVWFEQPDVATLRFPMVVHAPISAISFEGYVILSGHITSTGSQVYEPASLELKEDTKVFISNGKITQITGCKEDVENINDHYRVVAKKFNIDAKVVHSWHSGIHEGLDPKSMKFIDADHWSNSVFGSPRYLHFHTCGDYAPGEICWVVKEPTVKVDGIPLWEKGRINFFEFDPLLQCREQWPDLQIFH